MTRCSRAKESARWMVVSSPCCDIAVGLVRRQVARRAVPSSPLAALGMSDTETLAAKMAADAEAELPASVKWVAALLEPGNVPPGVVVAMNVSFLLFFACIPVLWYTGFTNWTLYVFVILMAAAFVLINKLIVELALEESEARAAAPAAATPAEKKKAQ